jgi:hypothetical protein
MDKAISIMDTDCMCAAACVPAACAVCLPAGGMDQAISIMGMPGIAKMVEFNPVGGWAGWAGWERAGHRKVVKLKPMGGCKC